MRKINRKNFPLQISVFLAAFVVSIIGYVFITQNIESYQSIRRSMPEDLGLYSGIDRNLVSQIKKLDKVKQVGLRSDPSSLRYKRHIFILERYDEEYFSMQKDFLKKGKIPHKGEVLLSDKTMDQLKLKVGDSFVLEEGKRRLKGQKVDPELGYNKNESFEKSGQRQVRISGIYRTTFDDEIQKIYTQLEGKDKVYPAIKVKQLGNIYLTKDKIEKIVGQENFVILNEGVTRLLNISEDGFDMVGFFLSKLLVPFTLIILFTFMIKNIFNIWGIYKIKVFSMYKSIGATNFQIYVLLLKEIFKTSLIPMVLGETLGLTSMLMIFNRLFSLQEDLLSKEIGRVPFHWSSVLVINMFLLIIVILSTTFPVRTISRVEILEGLRENIQKKNFKKRKRKDLFQELRVNNRKSLRPAMIVMISGLTIIGVLFGVKSINDYNTARHEYERDFNFLLRYSTRDNQYPEIFEEMVERFQPKKSRVSIRKAYYADVSNLKLSQAFKQVGFDKSFDEKKYYSKEQLVFSSLIGLGDLEFKKIGGDKDDVILLNLVQKNPKDFYSQASFIPYLDHRVDKISIKPLEEMEGQDVKITKIRNNFVEGQEEVGLYEIVLFTSIENFQKIMERSKVAFQKKKMEFPRLYYELEMVFEEKDLRKNTRDIDKIMKNRLEADEKYDVTNKVLDKKSSDLNDQSILFLGMIIITAVIVLNLANSYSSSYLTFFNRKNEIGVLLSNGMYRKSLEKRLLKNMKKSLVKSLLMSVVLTILLMSLLLLSSPYIDLRKYISILSLELPIFLFLLVISLSYFIYYFAMKEVTEKSIIDLIKSN